jgi:hypothetical protein
LFTIAARFASLLTRSHSFSLFGSNQFTLVINMTRFSVSLVLLGALSSAGLALASPQAIDWDERQKQQEKEAACVVSCIRIG